MDKAVTYLTNNQKHMRYDKALGKGWPIATGGIIHSSHFGFLRSETLAVGATESFPQFHRQR